MRELCVSVCVAQVFLFLFFVNLKDEFKLKQI